MVEINNNPPVVFAKVLLQLNPHSDEVMKTK